MSLNFDPTKPPSVRNGFAGRNQNQKVQSDSDLGRMMLIARTYLDDLSDEEVGKQMRAAREHGIQVVMLVAEDLVPGGQLTVSLDALPEPASPDPAPVEQIPSEPLPEPAPEPDPDPPAPEPAPKKKR